MKKMGRRKKPETIEEELILVNNLIEENENTLKDLKKRKNEIEKVIKEKKLKELDKVIAESGKSYEEILDLLTSKESKLN